VLLVVVVAVIIMSGDDSGHPNLFEERSFSAKKVLTSRRQLIMSAEHYNRKNFAHLRGKKFPPRTCYRKKHGAPQQQE